MTDTPRPDRTLEEIAGGIRHRMQQQPSASYIFVPRDWLDVILAALSSVQARTREAEQERDEIDRKYREQLWLAHGHVSELYGDDGERQCNHRDCMIDFKRWPLEQIEARMSQLSLKRLAEAQSQLASIESGTREAVRDEPEKDFARGGTRDYPPSVVPHRNEGDQ